MHLIRQALVVGERLGKVPEEAPQTPLQMDLQRLQKRLRLPVSADERDFELDLRKPLELERSHLLHRLNLLGISWGRQRDVRGKKGTFHEHWRLKWHPEFVVDLVSAARWGNTVQSAASAYTADRVATAADLALLTALLDDALLADLPEAVAALMSVIQERAAVGGDVLQLMAALPPLARVSRYGNVRQTDVQLVLEVVDGLVARICVGLPAATSSLNDDAARQVFDLIVDANDAIALLQQERHSELWFGTLRKLADQQGLHGLLSGRATRLLHDRGVSAPDETARRMSLALSSAAGPVHAAVWIEGFLRGSGILLIHDESIWTLMDDWVCALGSDRFLETLPLVRRTFATFPAPERRQMGSRVKRGPVSAVSRDVGDSDFDYVRADAALPLLARVLGVEDVA
jgi:hypothetical protein